MGQLQALKKLHGHFKLAQIPTKQVLLALNDPTHSGGGGSSSSNASAAGGRSITLLENQN